MHDAVLIVCNCCIYGKCEVWRARRAVLEGTVYRAWLQIALCRRPRLLFGVLWVARALYSGLCSGAEA